MSGFENFVGIAGIVAAVVAVIALWRQFRGGDKRVVQKMTRSEDSSQSASGGEGGVHQQMKETRGGKQDVS